MPDFINFLQDNQTKQLAIEIAYQNLSEESSEREVADLLHVIALSSIAEAIEQKKIQQQEAKRVGNQQLEAELTMEDLSNWLDSLKLNEHLLKQ